MKPEVFFPRRGLTALLLLSTSLLSSSEARADAFTGTGSSGAANLSKSRLGLVYIGFSGKTGSSLDSATGVGVEFQRERQFSWASYFLKFRMESSSATKTFDDSGTNRSLAYKYLAGFGALGFKWSPFQGTASGLNLYLGAAVDLGFAQITLPANAAYTSVKSSDSNMATGYELQAGFSFPIGGRGSQNDNWGLFFEAAYRQITSSLQGKSSFDLGGIQFSGGFYW